MGIHRFILSLVLLLGLGHVAFAYPAFNPGCEVEARELDERQGATASPFLNQEALCDKNCYKTRNACVAKWGPSDGNCIDNYNSCVKACNAKFGKRELEARVALPVEIDERQQLDREALCDKNCVAIRNKCAFDGGLNSVGACDKDYNTCLENCAVGFPPVGDRWTKLEVDTRALPEAIEIEERTVEIDKRDSNCIDLEGLCQKNCMATRNACIAPVGTLSGAMAKCVENYEKCMAVCPFFEGQCVSKRDPEVVEIEERAVELDDRALSKKKMCDQSCADTRRKCAGISVAIGYIPASCQNYYDRCINRCSFLAPPGTKRAAHPEPVQIKERAVKLDERDIPPHQALCNKNYAITLHKCTPAAGSVVALHTLALPTSCYNDYEYCKQLCKFITNKRALPEPVIRPRAVGIAKRALPEPIILPRAVEIANSDPCISKEGLCQKNCAATRNSCAAPVGILSSAASKCEDTYIICMKRCEYDEGICVGKRALPEPELLPHAAAPLSHAAWDDKTPCEKDATGNCKNQAKVCVGGRCLAHLSYNSSTN